MPGVQVREGLQAGYGWSEELEQLAARAEQLQAREAPPTLQELVDLAQDWLAYGFLSLTPAVVARSARLSCRLGVPVLAGVARLDQQVDEVYATRWRVRSQAGGVTVRPVEEAPLPEALDLEEPAPPALQERQPRRSREQRMRTAPIPRSEAEQAALEQQQEEARQRREQRIAAHRAQSFARDEAPPLAPAVEQPAPSPPRRRRQAPPPMPEGWIRGVELAARLGVPESSLNNYRVKGRLGREGQDWQWGVNSRNRPTAIYRADVQLQPLERHRPEGIPPEWLHVSEASELLEVDKRQITYARDRGYLGAEGEDTWLQPNMHQLWLSPATVEQLEERLQARRLNALTSEVQADSPPLGSDHTLSSDD